MHMQQPDLLPGLPAHRFPDTFPCGPLLQPPTAMYVFIKITRLAGYRAPMPVPAAPVPAASEPVQPDPVPEYEHHYAEL